MSCFGRSHRELKNRRKSPAPKTSRFFLEISGGVDQRGEGTALALLPGFDLLPLANWAAVNRAREEAAGLEGKRV